MLTFHKSASAYSSISYGKLDMVYNRFAVIIRDEKVYTAPAHGKAVFLVSEGSRVETNQPVAVLYKENYDEVIVKQLYDIQEKNHRVSTKSADGPGSKQRFDNY